MKRSFLYIIFILNFSIFSIFAQRGDCKVIRNTNAIKLYNKAFVMPEHKYKEAISLLKEAVKIKKNYVDAHYKIGEILITQASRFSERDIEKTKEYIDGAERSFLKVIELCPSFHYYDSYFYLSRIYFDQRNYNTAKQFVETFLEHNNENSEHFEYIEKISDYIENYFSLLNNPVPFNPIQLQNICSNDDEYLPLMSPDEEILIFSRKKRNTREKIPEKIMISHRDWSDSSEYKFKRGKPMNAPFNDGRNQGAASITIDNNHIFITICEYIRSGYTSFKNCDIYTSDNENGKWSLLRKMGNNINGSHSFEGMPSVTADGKTLFFASAREGGYGGIDIYKSEKLENGDWGKAQNLGPVINTKGDDKTPFIHSDSQTLYFASNGRLGMGGFDVFFSQYKGLGQWSEPQNIGYPINTINDELGFTVSADGSRIFFSSKSYNKDGNWDIYTATLYEPIRPKRVLFVKGNITDTNGNDLSNVEVDLTSLESKQASKGMVNPYTGRYAVAIPVIKNNKYLLTLSKNKYIFDCKLINPDLEKFHPPTNIDFKLYPVEKNKAFRLNYVNFEYGSHKLNKLSRLSINQLIKLMKENEKFNIILQGHTDNRGAPEFNLTLSKLRVLSVRKYLLQQGINAQRVNYKWYGETRPKQSNSTEEGRRINRRVEFIIKK